MQAQKWVFFVYEATLDKCKINIIMMPWIIHMRIIHESKKEVSAMLRIYMLPPGPDGECTIIVNRKIADVPEDTYFPLSSQTIELVKKPYRLMTNDLASLIGIGYIFVSGSGIIMEVERGAWPVLRQLILGVLCRYMFECFGEIIEVTEVTITCADKCEDCPARFWALQTEDMPLDALLTVGIAQFLASSRRRSEPKLFWLLMPQQVPFNPSGY